MSTPSGKCTLRAAVMLANALYSATAGSRYTITLPANGLGLFNDNTATFFLRETLLSNNVDLSSSGNNFPDCAGTYVSEGYNLVQAPAGCTLLNQNGEIFFQNPNLSILQNNGGPTLTMALPQTSVAVDSGDPAGCKDANGNPLLVDQRGYPRLSGCDIGAYEFVLQTFLPVIRRLARLDRHPTWPSLPCCSSPGSRCPGGRAPECSMATLPLSAISAAKTEAAARIAQRLTSADLPPTGVRAQRR